MEKPVSRRANAGGFLIAAGVTIGAIVGVIERQPTIGVLAGLGVSAALAILLWMVDRRGE